MSALPMRAQRLRGPVLALDSRPSTGRETALRKRALESHRRAYTRLSPSVPFRRFCKVSIRDQVGQAVPDELWEAGRERHFAPYPD